MYSQAIGSGAGSVLSGLAARSSPFGKGQAMQAASGLNMDREQKNQDFAVKQMQDESQQRQQASRTAAARSSNESQERTAAANAASRSNVFDVGMRFDYAGLQKRQQLNLQQALLNGIARDF